jgi:four helix bundle protein
MMTHRNLEVWSDRLNLIEMIYKSTRDFPEDKKFGLVVQIRKAAVSIPSNIVEGYARNYPKELIQFLYVALGSLSELETQFIISKRLKYITSDELLNLTERIRRKLLNLIKYHKSKLR